MLTFSSNFEGTIQPISILYSNLSPPEINETRQEVFVFDTLNYVSFFLPLTDGIYFLYLHILKKKLQKELIIKLLV